MEEFQMNQEEKNIPSLREANPEQIAKYIVELLDMKKAQDICLMKVEEQTILANYFVICGGSSNTQIRALAGEIEYKLGLSQVPLLRMEGYEDATWVILDFGCVMVHILSRNSRGFYQLEKLWGDAENIDISALLKD